MIVFFQLLRRAGKGGHETRQGKTWSRDAMQKQSEQSGAEQSGVERSRAEQSRAEQSRAGQGRAEQGREDQSRAEQSRAKQSRAGQSRAEQGRAEHETVQGRAGQETQCKNRTREMNQNIVDQNRRKTYLRLLFPTATLQRTTLIRVEKTELTHY